MFEESTSPNLMELGPGAIEAVAHRDFDDREAYTPAKSDFARATVDRTLADLGLQE
jgi:hypothetical protein